MNSRGNLLIVDSENKSIRMISRDGFVVSTLLGQGILTIPISAREDRSENTFIVDRGANVIRRISSDGEVSIAAGKGHKGNSDGISSEARFFYPRDLSIDDEGKIF